MYTSLHALHQGARDTSPALTVGYEVSANEYYHDSGLQASCLIIEFAIRSNLLTTDTSRSPQPHHAFRPQ
jgi:hypothetical protein